MEEFRDLDEYLKWVRESVLKSKVSSEDKDEICEIIDNVKSCKTLHSFKQLTCKLNKLGLRYLLPINDEITFWTLTRQLNP